MTPERPGTNVETNQEGVNNEAHDRSDTDNGLDSRAIELQQNMRPRDDFVDGYVRGLVKLFPKKNELLRIIDELYD